MPDKKFDPFEDLREDRLSPYENAFSPDATIRPATPYERRRFSTELALGALPSIFLAGGAAVGGPVGGALGGTAGIALKSALKKTRPDLYGPSSDYGIGSQIFDTILSSPFIKAGKSGYEGMKQSLKERVLPLFDEAPDYKKEAWNWAISKSGGKVVPTMGQATENKLLQVIENLPVLVNQRMRQQMVNAQKEFLEQESNQLISGTAGPFSTTRSLPGNVAERATSTLQKAERIAKANRDMAWSNLLKNLKSNTMQIEGTTIEAPISVDTFKQPLNELALTYAKYVPQIEAGQRPVFTNVISRINNVIKKGVVPMEELEAIKLELQGVADSINPLTASGFKKQIQGSVQQLRRLFDKAEIDTIKNSKLGYRPEQFNDYLAARQIHKEYLENYGAKSVRKTVRGEGSQSFIDTELQEYSAVEDWFRKFRQPKELELALRGTGGKNPAATGLFIQKLYHDAFDSSLNGPSGSKLISLLNNYKRTAAQLLTSDQRAAINNLAHVMESSQREASQVGTYSSALSLKNPIISFASGALAIALPGIIKAAPSEAIKAGAGGLATIAMGRYALTQLLLNPENARIAARLIRTPATSPMAKSLTRRLFSQLFVEGTPVMMRAANGTIREVGTVDSKGEIIPSAIQPKVFDPFEDMREPESTPPQN